MQIKIENFGPIKSFDFDLNKDFHVIYGKNNIGKSYAMSVVYVVLKFILTCQKDLYDKRLVIRTLDFDTENIEKNLNELLNSNSDNKSVDITPIFHDMLKEALSFYLLPNLRESFKNSFSKADNIQNRLSNDKFKISINLKNIKFNLVLDNSNELIINDLFFSKKVNTYFTNNTIIKNSITEITFPVNENYNLLLTDISIECFTEILLSFSAVSGIVSNIFFLPASRSGLYEGMNVFSSVFAKLSQSRNALNEKIEIPALSEPTSDYFLNLSNIDSSVKKDIYNKFSSEIEKDILDAEIIFNDHKKRLEYFNPKLKLKLDLSETSSMVSEIAPVVAHLKYIIKEHKNTNGHPSPPSKIIFIEEPEAHLHPEIQVKLIDIFTRLINHNIKIVLTTHSNYIFNKVNNLILANELNTKKIANYHIVQTDEGSIVKNEENLTDAGITDENFADIAQQLYNERLEILHQD